jgi:hypothetical protein
MRWIALPLLVAAAGCADETPLPGAPLGWGPASSTLYSPPAGGGGLVGDWMYCEDAACTTASGTGMRFAADGTWTTLYAFQWTEDAPRSYCLGWGHGSYSWHGGSLTLVDDQGTTLACTVAFSGDLVTIGCGDLYTGVMRRIDAGEVGPCPIYEDQAAGG